MPTLLVVDDEPLMLRFLRTVLEKEGFLVIGAGSGAQALELYRESAAKVDALVTDIVMPEMDGIALANELTRERPDLPVIFISAYVTCPPLKDRESRPFAFLRKPFSPARLSKTIREVLA